MRYRGFKETVQRLCVTVLDFETFVSLAKGAGWLATDATIDAEDVDYCEGIQCETSVTDAQ